MNAATVPSRTQLVRMPAGGGTVRLVTARPGAYAVGTGPQYDASSTATDIDFGSVCLGVMEDLNFTGALRQIAIARLRKEVRNNPYLAGLSAKYPEAVGTSSLRSRTGDKAYNEAKDEFYFRWSRHACVNAWSLRRAERISLIEDLHAGEMFVVLLNSGKIQLLASEFCGSPGGGTRYGENEISGIVYGDNHVPRAYRFGRLNRNGRIEWTGKDDELVPARYVIHDYDPDRILLGRGIPRLLPSLFTFRSLYEITRAKTKQIKDANALSGFIKSVNADAKLRGLGAPIALPEDANAAATTAAETLDSPADPMPADTTVFELSPGTFIALNPGEEAQTMMTEYHASDYKELVMLMLHAGSSPTGMPVELWFSGLGDVNYSGFKGLGTQWKSRREEICAGRQEQLLEPLQTWRTERAEIAGELPPNPEGPEAVDLVEFGWKRAAVLDDEKAAKSNQTALASGEKTHADIWEENGKFAEEELAKRRQLWIKLQIAAGKLEEGGDHAKVIVPEEFLLYNRLPGGAGPGASAGRPANPAASPNDDDTEEDDEENDDEDKEDKAAA